MRSVVTGNLSSKLRGQAIMVKTTSRLIMGLLEFRTMLPGLKGAQATIPTNIRANIIFVNSA